MKTYEKLAPQKITQVLKTKDWLNEKITTEENVQYFKIIETKEIVEENITTLENFELMVASLEEKKQIFIQEVDAEIAIYQETINELKKL